MKTGTAETYRVFVRNWWRYDSKAPNGLAPNPGARKTTLARRCTEDEAREICRRYRATHEPGRLSRKAEYEQE